ncbi:nucleosome remodeling factor, p48 subunit [Dorcoceras hygrometricum]|uniref:Nucleosome remodeling factor, p48 subunit n=1 Tax=Dorcoceras hygrometricum TaxID=472368 RepID=A0A2Z7BVH6_9LAMI|nr:nucleosome remodeling factor, p48 subunit [Dorcoceras hygrometricum]
MAHKNGWALQLSCLVRYTKQVICSRALQGTELVPQLYSIPSWFVRSKLLTDIIWPAGFSAPSWSPSIQAGLSLTSWVLFFSSRAIVCLLVHLVHSDTSSKPSVSTLFKPLVD